MKKKKKNYDDAFNFNSDLHHVAAVYVEFQMAVARSNLSPSRVLKVVAERFEFQAEDDTWRGCTTKAERNLYRRIAKFLHNTAERKTERGN